MARAVAVLLLITMLSAAGMAFGAPPQVTIDSVTFKGSGCSWDNTDYTISSDYTVVTFLFGGMIATTDSGLAGKRKNCGISFRLNYPQGWSVSVTKVTGRGYAKLDAGVTGTYQTSYFVSGQSGTEYVTRSAGGPLEGNYEFTDRFKRYLWSVCQTVPNVNLNVEVRVDGPPGANGVMTVDSTDNKFKLKYYFEWQAC